MMIPKVFKNNFDTSMVIRTEEKFSPHQVEGQKESEENKKRFVFHRWDYKERGEVFEQRITRCFVLDRLLINARIFELDSRVRKC